MIEESSTRIVVDAGPDFRQQLADEASEAGGQEEYDQHLHGDRVADGSVRVRRMKVQRLQQGEGHAAEDLI